MERKKKSKRSTILSDKIVEAITVKPSADIEDDHTFGTKPRTVTRDDLSNSDEEVAISSFRKSNVKLLSDINRKYEGEISSIIPFKDTDSESDNDSNNEDEGDFEESDYDVNDDEKKSDNEKLKHKLSDEEKSDDENFKLEFEDSDEDNEEQGDQDNFAESQEDESEGDSYDDDDVGYDLSEMTEPPVEEESGNFQHLKKSNISDEIKKGQSVRNQLLLWENLLEMRIHMQRCMTTANRLPMPDVHKQIRIDGGDAFVSAANKTTKNIKELLDNLLKLQDVLLKNNTDTKALSSQYSNKTPTEQAKEVEDSDEEIPSDTEDEGQQSGDDKDEPEPFEPTPAKKRKLIDYSTELSTKHKTFTPFRNSVIEKWNEKTRLTSANAHKTSSMSNSVLSQIKYILSDRIKLLKRTQLKRFNFDIIGYTEPKFEEHVPIEANDETNGETVNPAMRDRKAYDLYIAEIFDDSDFYHQLLRELIECKSADISDPIQLSRQWIVLQNMRSKMKRNVEKGATKGRKIRYVIHQKLLNFMAPEKNLSWSDESKNELYSSLFGKLFEGTGGDENIGVNPSKMVVISDNTKL